MKAHIGLMQILVWRKQCAAAAAMRMTSLGVLWGANSWVLLKWLQQERKSSAVFVGEGPRWLKFDSENSETMMIAMEHLFSLFRRSGRELFQGAFTKPRWFYWYGRT
jgi:hypothetical protein